MCRAGPKRYTGVERRCMRREDGGVRREGIRGLLQQRQTEEPCPVVLLRSCIVVALVQRLVQDQRQIGPGQSALLIRIAGHPFASVVRQPRTQQPPGIERPGVQIEIAGLLSIIA